ncbi:TPA: hypothetical protein QDB24_002973 [Burkholderia vietnamiensis]|uniref:hypothetical protein n=1 Tax=Burkholderia vietnamiensis TaxID=60552 RepID=UPI001B95A652|nr:hypothetical protein [Burkholderia vietnamiensis]MBR7910344.1 hypothetical protein [Burkholderia vietnamiensis]HDR9274892.1 hypothetical protein [Burkholderia vietnamiensis]
MSQENQKNGKCPLVVSAVELINMIGFVDMMAGDLLEITDCLSSIARSRNDIVTLALAESVRDLAIRMRARAIAVDSDNGTGVLVTDREGE